MKQTILGKMVLVSMLSVLIFSCKKEASVPATDYTTEANMQADDQAQFSSEVDAVANDASLALENEVGFTGRSGQLQTNYCNATAVVDAASNPRTITITYNGTGCLGNTTRTGSVVISMPSDTRWKNAGAAFTVTYNNLKITRLRDGKGITINGSHVITNVSGGLLQQLPTLQNITHAITSNNMSVSFDNAAQRVWKVAKLRTFTYNNGIVITTTGTHTEGNLQGVVEWGTNRMGQAFTSVISQPIVSRQDCNFRLTSGKIEHKTEHVNIKATLGLDNSGNPTSCPGSGVYFMKVDWNAFGGSVHSAVFPY
jgi:hypothetical protein